MRNVCCRLRAGDEEATTGRVGAPLTSGPLRAVLNASRANSRMAFPAST